MTSFQIGIKPNRRAAGRFISNVRRAIQNAFLEEKELHGTTQSDIATKLGVHRSVISRELRGYRDISLGRVAEYAWALNREIVFAIPSPNPSDGRNHSPSFGTNIIINPRNDAKPWQSSNTASAYVSTYSVS